MTDPIPPERAVRAPRPTVLLVLLGAAALVAIALLFDLVPFLRGGFGWQWRHEPAQPARLLGFAVLVSVALGAGWRLMRARPLFAIAWAAFSVIALTLGALQVRGDSPLRLLALRTLSPLATGHHTAAARIGWETGGWHDWAAYMARYDGVIAHVTLAPPALPLLFEAANRAFDGAPGLASALRAPLFAYQCHDPAFVAYSAGEWASAWLGVLMPAWAALAVFPLWRLARRLNGERCARLALVLFPLMPALLAFSPSWNTLYPLFALLVVWALDAALSAPRIGRRAGLAALSGALYGLAVFVNFAFVPLGLLCGLYTLFVSFGPRPAAVRVLRAWAVPVGVGAAFAFGFVAVWAAYFLGTGSTFWGILDAAFGRHFQLDYPYLPWIWLNFWDWALWTGLPLAVLWLAGAVFWPRRAADRAAALAAALALTIAILVFGNVARGETGRVWLVFAPFMLLSAAAVLARAADRRIPITAAIVQAGWCFAVVGVLIAMEDGLSAPPTLSAAVPVAHAADVRFADTASATALSLTGWDAVQRDSAVALTLRWQPDAPVFRPVSFSALLVGPGGPVSAAVVWQPAVPATCWPAGTVVTDTVLLPLPADAEPGGWWVSVFAFLDQADDVRLRPAGPAAERDQVGLGPVAVGPR